MPINIFQQDLLKAYFLSRPNRFVVRCLLDNKEVNAYLPNPGRLFELLIQGAILYLIRTKTEGIPYKVVGVLKDSFPVILDTHANNEVLKTLLQKGLIRGLERYDFLSQEVKVGDSRFDFLIKKDSTNHYIEAKSCTLFGDKIAMFPDAITKRGSKHLNELMRLAREGQKCHVVFLVHSPKALFFMPEYHIDLDFAQTFLEASKHIDIQAIGLTWTEDLLLSEKIRYLTIPFDYLKSAIQDSGGYLLILKMPYQRTLKIGALGDLDFKDGYYIYVGSAMKDLKRRIERHTRRHKKDFWHIDYLIKESQFITALPIRDTERIECLIAQKISSISDYNIHQFGSSDCDCKSHLFYKKENPLTDRTFIEALIWLRINRLTEKKVGIRLNEDFSPPS